MPHDSKNLLLFVGIEIPMCENPADKDVVGTVKEKLTLQAGDETANRSSHFHFPDRNQ